MKRYLLFGAALLSLVTISGCGRNPPEAKSTAAVIAADGHIRFPADSPQLTRIKTDVAKLQSVPEVEFLLPGKIEPDPTRVSKIALPASGRIRRVFVALGDRVRQGQTVLTIDSPDAATAMSAFRQAEANVAQAKAGQAKAELDLTRTRDLQQNGAAPQKDVLAAETVLAQAKAAVAEAEASRQESLKKLQVLGVQPGKMIDQTVSVSSPVSGKVIDINAVNGELRNDTNTPFLTVADLSIVWVTADVPEDRLRFVKVGATVDVRMNAYPGEVFKGRIARLGDMLDPQTRTMKIRAELKNPQERFRPEMFAQIQTRQGATMLPVIPRGALLESQGKSTVFVERSTGEFEEVPVSVGWLGPDEIAISKGVRDGDRVVTSGGMLLRGY